MNANLSVLNSPQFQAVLSNPQLLNKQIPYPLTNGQAMMLENMGKNSAQQIQQYNNTLKEFNQVFTTNNVDRVFDALNNSSISTVCEASNIFMGNVEPELLDLADNIENILKTYNHIIDVINLRCKSSVQQVQVNTDVKTLSSNTKVAPHSSNAKASSSSHSSNNDDDKKDDNMWKYLSVGAILVAILVVVFAIYKMKR